ncbi:transglycosylase SLT domain-containing protein [Dyella sp. A6]|uniref:transglycosylase SLT domain-containing protein n=1 Tax=Dyella aluminiiresistens TaxID=3069105 RepID=UPI002E7A8CE9|nr:transglycosylase SLT domain-containing protein [Dyella sp. A6]
MFPRLPVKNRARHLLTVLFGSVWLTACATAQSSSPAAHSLDAERAAFRQAWDVASREGGDSWRPLASGLHDYPLYPYLPFAALQHDIRQVDLATVQAYLQKYPGLIPADDLRREFLEELARRKDWAGFRTLYRPGINLTLACDALQAGLADGKKLDFQRDLAQLWSHPSLPGACDPVLQAAHDQGLLTNARLWSRIDDAVDAGRGGTVAELAAWLPAHQAETARKLALALRNPAAAAKAATDWPDTPRLRRAAAIAIRRLAYRDTDSADSAWQKLHTRFRFTPAQRDDILHALALYHAADFDPGSLARLIALPAAAQSDATRAWRVRLALAKQDWAAVLAAIQAMPPEQQDDGQWRYFRARALGELGQANAAQSVYRALAQQATYYGFLAADRIGAPYAICPQQPPHEPQRERALLDMPGLERAFELYAVNLPRYARSEWNRALRDSDSTTRQLAAELAHSKGWYDRAVFTFSHGDMLHYYDLRFPLARQDGLVAQARQAGIDPAWAYGILRSESAWVTDAQSGADARGLMQLLPSTAAAVARRNGLAWSGGDSLYDPAVNITLGTRHLAELAARFGNAPWLASAAYNAGSAKVRQWVEARGQLTPDVFIATMPYKETREYVARVMAFSVIYDWRLHGNVAPMSSRMPAYVDPPDTPAAMIAAPAQPARKSVVCPTDQTPAPASSVARPASSGTVQP